MAENPLAWNSTSPAAPAGAKNIIFQADAPDPNPSVGRPTTAYLPPFVASGVGHAPGLVPDPGAGAGATKFLREDASWAVPAGGGGGGGATVGTRAALPGTPGTSGSIYITSDTDYDYYSDGSAWYTEFCGYKGLDPGVDPGFILKHTVAPTGSTSDTTAGGIKFAVGSHAGDHVEGYLKPVSGLSASSAFALGFNVDYTGTRSQGGIVCYNSVTGKWTFFREAAGSMFVSQYIDTTGWVSNTSSNAFPGFWFPRRGVWGITFSGGNVVLSFFMDSDLRVNDPAWSAQSDGYSGGSSGITHIGFGANLGSNCWAQFFKQVR